MSRRRHLLLLSIASALLASLVGTLSAPAPAGGQRRRPSLAPIPDDVPPKPANATACNYQEPIEWLVRENFLPLWTQSPEEQRRRRGLQKRTQDFRTENYGYFEGFGNRRLNDITPSDNAIRVRFMDLPIRVNERIVPALECVEEQLRAECGEEGYEPRRLSGLRTKNTYHNSQVSNHVYGIAVDVDPRLNTCCRCVAQWGDHPLCQRDVESIYERMAMPSCWVHVFERFGFYWLGRDRLQDTMHFEFLGDPAHILKSSGVPPHMSEGGGASTVRPDEASTQPSGSMEPSSASVSEAPMSEGSMNEGSMNEAAMENASMQSAAIEADERVEGESVAVAQSAGGCGCSIPGL